jgi:hypothetical protein
MRWLVVVVVFALASVAIGVTWSVFAVEYLKESNPLARDAIEREDYGVLARTTVRNDLAIAERPWHGADTAPVTVIAVIDPRNPTSGAMLTTLEDVIGERIEKGVVKVGIKYLVIDDDSVEGKDTFKYAAAGRCLEAGPAWLDDLRGLVYGTSTPATVEASVGPEMFAACRDAEALIEDAYHIRTQRVIAPSILIGTDTRAMGVLYGAPDPADLEQAVRQYEIRFGI